MSGRRGLLLRQSGIWVAVLAVLLFTAGIWTSKDPFVGSGTDIVTFEHPFQSFARERLLHGDIPFWNPYELGGVPFEAGVHGHLSPSYWSSLVFPPLMDLGHGFVLHLVVAAAGMAYWASRRGLRKESQALAGIVYALSAFLILHCFAGHRRFVFTAAYLPWVAAFAQDVTWSGRRWILATVATGLAIWCGHFQVLYIGFLGLLLFFFIESWSGDGSRWKRIRRTGVGLSTMFVAGAALALIRIVPALDTLLESQRAAGSEPFAATYPSTPANLLTFAWPHLFGNHVDTKFIGNWAYWESLGYLGALPLLLLLLAPFVLRGRKWVAGWILLVFGATVSLGAATPFFDLYLELVPGAQLFRSPGRYLLWIALFAPIIAAEVLDALLDRPSSRPSKINGLPVNTAGSQRSGPANRGVTNRARRREGVSQRAASAPRRERLARMGDGLLVVAPIVALVLFLVVRFTGVADWQRWLLGFGAQIQAGPFSAETWEELHQAAVDDALRAFVVLTIAAALLLFARRIPQSIRAWSIVALVLLDLVAFGHRFLVTGPASTFEWPPGLTQFLQEQNDPGLRILDHPDLRSPGRGAAFGIAQVGGYDTFLPADYMRFIRTTRGLEPDALVSWYKTSVTNPAIDRLGARFFLHPGELGPNEAKASGFSGWAEAARFGDVVVYENPNPSPRVFITHAVQQSERIATYRTLINPQFRVTDMLLVEDAPPREFSFDAVAEAVESASIEVYEPDRVVIEATAGSNGALVFTDNWHRDWQCRIDGQKVPVIRANAIMRAVPIGPGTHEVVFEFRSRPFALGAIGSTSSLVILGVFATVRRRRERGSTNGARRTHDEASGKS